jgi:hypothetical protein
VRLSPQEAIIVRALRSTFPTHMRLLHATGIYRYPSRIHDLRKKGFGIITNQLGQGEFEYKLFAEPPELVWPEDAP